MADITLEQPSVPVSCDSGHVSKANCTVTFRCHDRLFKDAELVDGSGDRLFIFSGGGIFSSWSVRRTLKDANERHILDIRHYKSSMSQWIVEDPNGKQLCLVKESESKVPKATAMQAQVTAEDVVGGHVTVDIQSSDHAGSITTFHVEGKAIAEMHLVQNNDISFLGQKGLDRSAWKIHVVGGVDMALILALAYCRAYILHAWRR